MPDMEDDEQYLIEDAEAFQPGSSRLSCQIEVDDNMVGIKVTIAPEG